MITDVSQLSQLEKFAKDLVAQWKAQPNSQVFWLQGPMGSGKTTFVRYLVGDQASSPSFALQQVYEVAAGTIQHWDLDRIGSFEELEATGFFDIFQASRKSLILVEWANRLTEFGRLLYAPHGFESVQLQWVVEKDRRQIRLDKLAPVTN